MVDIWSLVQWWDDWQLRVLVLGSLGFQWFLLLAAPMRKYTVPQAFRTCIWLAYISSDALAIYALATLFNRHARTVPASNCAPGGPAGKEQLRMLEVLWAPVLLIHLGGQEELTAYEIEDNELWTRHTVTLVTQVAVALYAFYKSWQPSSSDWKLTAAAVLLFIIGVISFSEKPLALNRAKIKRLAAVSAWIQGTGKRSIWRERLSQFFLFEESNCFAGGGLPRLSTTPTSLLGGDKGSGKQKQLVALSEADKVLMVLSDLSLLAAAKDLVARGRAKKVEDVLPPLPVVETLMPRWLRRAFAFIYTRASVVLTPLYLLYHLLVVPALHLAALTLFATSDKHKYKRADVKITYIILSLTAALDFLAVFIRQLVYQLMAMTEVPALCETVPRYNLIDGAIREADRGTGWIYMCARRMGLSFKEEYFSICRPRHGELYKKVSRTVIADLVEEAEDRDLASFRNFDSSAGNWVLSDELKKECRGEIKNSLVEVSFDRCVLLWHIATDLCFRCSTDGEEEEQQEKEKEKEGEKEQEEEKKEVTQIKGEEEQEKEKEKEKEKGEEVVKEEQVEEKKEVAQIKGAPQGNRDTARQPTLRRVHMECAEAISNYMAHLLNSNPDMLLTGSRHHLISEARNEVKSYFLSSEVKGCDWDCNCSCTGNGCSCSGRCGELNQGAHGRFISQKGQLKQHISRIAALEPPEDAPKVFHIKMACKLAMDLLAMEDDDARWKLMYRVWLGMLCYSASMCRGYLHAKSLGEGGEFLSFVWLVLSLKGARTLADKLQMPPKAEASDNPPKEVRDHDSSVTT